jgi:hypothetical protein
MAAAVLTPQEQIRHARYPAITATPVVGGFKEVLAMCYCSSVCFVRLTENTLCVLPRAPATTAVRRFRTEMCMFRAKCNRPVCFFAHSMQVSLWHVHVANECLIGVKHDHVMQELK